MYSMTRNLKFLIIILSVFLIFGIQSCSTSQKRSMKLYSQTLDSNIVFDAIIVPGMPYYEETGKWSDVIKIRIYWAHYLYSKGIAKNIIFSGSAVYTPYVEAKIMKLYAIELGIPTEHIFIEDKAEHSTENVHYSMLLADEKGFASIALATDPYQTAMVKKFMKKNFPELKSLPIVFSILQTVQMLDPQIDSQQAFVPDFIPLTERQGVVERFRGTRGKHIK